MPILTTDQGWVLETRTAAYALGLNRAGLLTNRYWGARLPHLDDSPAAPTRASGVPSITHPSSRLRSTLATRISSSSSHA
ncbi:MAG: hypothetical protein ACUVS4_15480 [Chloroflexaceae bacterium]